MRIEGKRLRDGIKLGGVAGVVALSAFTLATWLSLHPAPRHLPGLAGSGTHPIVEARDGRRLSSTYENRWNVHDVVPLYAVPETLRQAFLVAEDRRFYEHNGPDWQARFSAAWQNVMAGGRVRGASTITEQSARILNPRTRSVWARWLEGFEAGRLERRFGKGAILEFYLNQVPFGGRRRGVVQAARYYFDRDLETLSVKEMLTLAVLVRSPSRLDPRKGHPTLDPTIKRLADAMRERGLLDEAGYRAATEPPLVTREHELELEAPHFVRRALGQQAAGGGAVRSTLDVPLQREVAGLLQHQVELLKPRGVTDGAVLVVDHHRDEVLAWVNAEGVGRAEESRDIDAVLTPRQPGSTLKPFVYAMALEQGWTAATLIHDSPLEAAVGNGLHAFRNYSRTYHGPLRLRSALASSLNVPAVRALGQVGTAPLLERLREAGFHSLSEGPEVYGDGLALGNGEVTLRELVEAYATLARGGIWRPLRELGDGGSRGAEAREVFDPAVASLIGDILSDPDARSLEFGQGGVLDFPVQTAVKTGTSNDYRDAWAVGFSDRHTVGVWLGNLDRQEMRGVTGSVGPALVLRGVFAELRRRDGAAGLPLDRQLVERRICRHSGRAPGAGCSNSRGSASSSSGMRGSIATCMPWVGRANLGAGEPAARSGA